MNRSSRARRSNAQRRRAWSPLWRIVSWYQYRPLWQQRLILTAAAFAAVTTVTGLLIWAHRTDLPGRIATAVHEATVGMTVRAGFAVQEVYVAGRKETARPELIDAIGVKIGDPLLYFDATAARERLIAIGWVEDARVERRLPDRIVVTLKERTPIAIWQRSSRFLLVDHNGHVIGPDGVQRYARLKIIIGEDAPKHATNLFAMLEREPEMMQRVTHATWVSGRQWTIRIEDSIDVRLPADNPEAAWQKLTEMEREYGVLNRDITTVDLRVPDHTAVRMNRKPQPAAARGDET